jgi:hypothetical protein
MRSRRKKPPHIRKGELFVLPGCAPKVYREIMAAERAALYASPERCAEIERRQPESESYGRSVLYYPDAGARRSTRTRCDSRPKKHSPVEQTVEQPQWRKTFEFDGEEDALDENEIVVLAD